MPSENPPTLHSSAESPLSSLSQTHQTTRPDSASQNIRQATASENFDFSAGFESSKSSSHLSKSRSARIQHSSRTKSFLDYPQAFNLPIENNLAVPDRFKFNNIDEDVDLDEKTTDVTDKFQEFQNWLIQNGAEFPDLYLKSYSTDMRGIHCSQSIQPLTTIVSVPRKCLITDDMGRTQTRFGSQLFSQLAENPESYDRNLSTPKIIAVVIYIIETMNDPNHFFSPYYKILPKDFSNFPIFWSEEQLEWLKGSAVLTEIQDRIATLKNDYALICKVIPQFTEICDLNMFLEIRTVVGSRNFGITINGVKTTAMVPFADMLNHYRPRETSWKFDDERSMSGSFTIESTKPLEKNQQVMDSYGIKCNSKFFLHYGFSVERNREQDGSCKNETSLLLEFNSKLLDQKDLNMRKITFLGRLINMNLDDKSSSYLMYRNFRMSMNPEDSGTVDALFFLRIKHATAKEFGFIKQPHDRASYPPQYYRGSVSHSSFISASNEIKVLDELQIAFKAKLLQYKNTYEQNLSLLQDKTIEPFSGRRTALILIAGEQEICHFWIKIYEIVKTIFDSDSRFTEKLRSVFSQYETDQERDIHRYCAALANQIDIFSSR